MHPISSWSEEVDTEQGKEISCTDDNGYDGDDETDSQSVWDLWRGGFAVTCSDMNILVKVFRFE